VNYCDGLSFTGDRDEPVPTGYGGQQIWLRGKRNLEAVFAALAADHGTQGSLPVCEFLK